MWTRRGVLELGLGSWLLSQGLPGLARAAATPKTTSLPRYFCFIYLGGGIDQILTTDPKSRSDLERWVDLPYAPKQVIETPHFPLGPHLAPLAPHSARLALINGVRTRTVSHQTGALQSSRMRTKASFHMPTIQDLVGSKRD